MEKGKEDHLLFPFSLFRPPPPTASRLEVISQQLQGRERRGVWDLSSSPPSSPLSRSLPPRMCFFSLSLSLHAHLESGEGGKGGEGGGTRRHLAEEEASSSERLGVFCARKGEE